MADHSAIEWTETTWNPTTGCDKVSPGCDNCYALKLAKRLKAMGSAKYQNDGDPRTSGPGFGLAVHPTNLIDVIADLEAGLEGGEPHGCSPHGCRSGALVGTPNQGGDR